MRLVWRGGGMRSVWRGGGVAATAREQPWQLVPRRRHRPHKPRPEAGPGLAPFVPGFVVVPLHVLEAMQRYNHDT